LARRHWQHVTDSDRCRALRFCIGGVPRLPGHLARAAAFAHSFDVGDERHLRHFFGWLDCDSGGTGPHHAKVATILGFIAVVCSTSNVVGGFALTDRMLRMFKRKK
jgi:hypothetical protein